LEAIGEGKVCEDSIKIRIYECIPKTRGWAMAQGDDHGPVSLIDVRRLPQFKCETFQVASLDPTSQTPDSEDTPIRYRNDP
jgi:hypothetical protein